MTQQTTAADERRVLVQWRSDPSHPNPWEQWVGGPLRTHLPSSINLLQEYYRHVHDIGLTEVVQVEIQSPLEWRRSFAAPFHGDRGLVIRARAPLDRVDVLLGEGWRRLIER